MSFELLVKKIKQKKELSGIENSIVAEHLDNYLTKHKLPLNALTPSEIKLIIKDIREILRRKVGMFQASVKDRQPLLKSGNIEALLQTHSSTKERIDFYPQLKEIIKKLKVKSILDLGCGINPLALAEPGIRYYASDINLKELKLIEKFFAEKTIEGKAFFCDLTKIEKCSLPESDICLILKVFDILGKNVYLIAEKVISCLKSKYLLVSFSARTLSGRRMSKPRRIWFEKLLGKTGYSFEIIKSDSEIFYLSKRG